MISNQAKYAVTPSGEIAYIDRERGPTAPFVHGVFLNNNLWRNVIDVVCDHRRCACSLT